MIHLYCGDGKGKTTAAMGLALRAAGRDREVLIAQFLKGDDTGERRSLERLPQITLLPLPRTMKFVRSMSQAELAAEQARYARMWQDIDQGLDRRPGLLVLDEVFAAVNHGLFPVEQVLSCLDRCTRLGVEVVLTGRDPHPALTARADYITEMVKLRHPFELGVRARPGVEF